MKIGIIFAMQEELDAFLNRVETYEVLQHKNLLIYTVAYKTHTCVCVLSGIGKVNAAYATTIIIDTFKVDAVLNSGVAGGVNIDVGTTVIGEATVHHDVDVTAFQYAYGQVPGHEATFKGDETLIQKAIDVAALKNMPVKSAMIASGDQFVTSLRWIEKVLEAYPNTVAIEMEAAAIAQVCTLEAVPHLILRAISDVIGGKGQPEDFKAFLTKSSENVADLLTGLLESL